MTHPRQDPGGCASCPRIVGTMPSTPTRGTVSRSQTYRQRSAQLLGWLCIGVAAMLGIGALSSWSRDPNPAFVAWLAVAIGFAWSLFLRPHVRLAAEGVTLANVLRDVFIPWGLVEEVRTRWNLEVLTADRSYTSWAISTQIARPRSGLSTGLLGGLGGGRAGRGLTGGATTEPPAGHQEARSVAVTSRAVAETIEATRDAYVAEVASGRLAPVQERSVRVRWQPGVVAALVVPLATALVLATR